MQNHKIPKSFTGQKFIQIKLFLLETATNHLLIISAFSVEDIKSNSIKYETNEFEFEECSHQKPL